MTALELIGVSKEHPGSPPVAALMSVTVTIRTGEFTAIVGPSGSGKSTMLAIAGTLERPTAGSVRVAGLAVDGLPDDALAGIRAGRDRVRLPAVLPDPQPDRGGQRSHGTAVPRRAGAPAPPGRG